MKKYENRIILALDVVDAEKAIKIASELRNYVDAIKINYPLILAQGLNFINKLTVLNDVICDIKLADIPNTNKLIVQEIKKYNVSGIIVHGFVGSDSVKTAVEEFKGRDVFVVAEMSHPGALEYMQPHSEKIAIMAKEVGAAGIIVPATRPDRIKIYRNLVGNLKILTPGVGAQGGDAKLAIANGADYIIVGRSLYESKDPVATAKSLIFSIK
ncbi:MAG: orotidine-5'-phosphate decarboxylase [Thermoplasmata archaeon]